MEERRKRNRKQLRFFTRVIDSHTGRFLGYLANLTMDGAMMISHRILNKDTVLNFQIDLPENYAPHSQLGLHANAIWSQPDTDPEFYKVGLKLVELTPEETAILERLLDEFGLE